MNAKHLKPIVKALLCISLLIIVMVFGFSACKKKNRADSKSGSKSESSSSGKNSGKEKNEDDSEPENKDDNANVSEPDDNNKNENNDNNESNDNNSENNDTVTYDSLINEGSSYLYSNDYAQALRSFERAVNLDPSKGLAYIQLYYVYMNIGDIDSAEAIVNKGLSNVTDNSGILTLNILSEDIRKERERINGADENINLTIWCTSDYTTYRTSFGQAVEDMKTRFPNIQIQIEAFEMEAYKEKLKAAVLADSLPDIFCTWTGTFLKEFVSRDRIYCLDDVLKDYIGKDIDKGKFSSATFDGKIYGVPMNMNVAVIFANMDILEKVGYSYVPRTYEELMECCDRLLSAGITPFGCSGKETWCVSEYYEPMVEKIIGAESLHRIFTGKDTFDNSGLALGVDLLYGMISCGYFDPDGMKLGNEEIKSNFIDGKYAFYMNGTWNSGDFYNHAGFKIQVAEFPVINSSEASLGQFIGGPYDCLSVAKSSRYTAVAAEYAVELAKAVSRYGYLEGSGLPTWNVDYDDSSMNYIVRQAVELCKKAEFSCFGDSTMPENEAQIYYNYLSQIYIGGINSNDFIKGLSSYIR